MHPGLKPQRVRGNGPVIREHYPFATIADALVKRQKTQQPFRSTEVSPKVPQARGALTSACLSAQPALAGWPGPGAGPAGGRCPALW